MVAMEGVTPNELWTGLIVGVGSQLLILAYGVGQFKANFGAMKNELGFVKEDVSKLKRLVAMVWFGPDVDAEVLTSDVDVMRAALAHRRATDRTAGAD